MARIPETDIERLKNDISVERLVESAGIALKKSGKDRIGLCPFHEDREPSLIVTPEKNLWHCFGCQSGGGPIDWVMKLRGISFRHAVELLHTDPSLAAQSVSGLDAPVKRGTVRTLPAPVAFDADKQALLNQTVSYYHTTLQQSPEALAYLRERGLEHPELIEHFLLGYANRTLGLRLPQKNRLAGAEIRTRLQEIGIYRDSGHEHFNGSLIVPVIDAQGNVTEVYGRKIRDDLRKGIPSHLYLPGPHRGVWNEPALIASKEIILCEALIDAMTFWCAGYRNVTASYGVEGFTDDHLAAFKAHGTERVLIAYDRDDAGDHATDKLAARLMAEGIDCYRIQFPKGMDANEYALKVQPASKSLGVLIRKAVWIGNGQAPQRPLAQLAQFAVPAPATAPSADAAPVPSLAAEQVAAPPLPASPLPPAPAAVKPDIKDHEINLSFGEGTDRRRYRVRGFAKNLAVDVLKINLLAATGDAFHVDTLDLYSAKQRAAYVQQAAQETGIDAKVLKTDLGRVLLTLEQVQDEQIQKVLHPEPEQKAMADTDRDSALALLKSPDLLNRILADFDACGLVGEHTNKLVAYLAAVSRKLAGPLAIVVQSSSAAGKSSLMDAVLAFVPEDERVKYSAMTGQSLFYMGETNLKHKILAICEEEGASRASYALKLLQSDGELTMASTGKDPDTGNLITQAYRVEGPVMIFLTTTAIEIDEELLNRCIVLSVDEGREQTEAIHRLQREKRTLQGLQVKQEKQRLIALHQNAQRLLRPLAVVNPYADQLTFLSDRTRTRRDHEKYLTLIDTIALLHQHQRTIKSMPGSRGNDGEPLEYIEVTLDDISAANRLSHDVLGRSLDDLPPQTRRLLAALVEYVTAECETQQLCRADLRLTRKAVRAATGWGDTQLRLHLERLVQMEYLLAHREGNGGRFVYELLYDGDAHQTVHLSGLLDPNQLESIGTTAKSRGQECEVAGRLRGSSGPIAAPLRTLKTAQEPASMQDADESNELGDKTRILRANGKAGSYPQAPVVPAIAPLAAGV